MIIRLESWDGSNVFTLYGDGEGDRGVYLLEDPVGLIDAPITTTWQQSTYGVGARMTGVTYEPRDLHLPLGVVCDSSPEGWRRVDSILRQAFSEYHDSRLTATTENGTRHLNVRLFDTPQMNNKHDPSKEGYASTIFNLRAGNPMWQGDREVITWDFTGKNFYDHITIDNPGDRPLWPQWILPGPTSVVLPDYDISAGKEHWVRMPFQRTGQDVLVDTRPDREEAVCAGHPMWLATLPDHFLHPIPPHTVGFELPIVMNPYPFADAVMQAIGLPTRLPTEFIVASAKAMVGELAPFDAEEIRLWSPDDLANRLFASARKAAEVVGEVGQNILAEITVKMLSRLIGETYTVVDALVDQQIGLVLQPEYSRPWGML